MDNDPSALVDPGHLLAVDVDPLSEGPHEVRAAVCSSDGVRCTTPTAHAFSVVRTVAAGFSVLPSAFSPNGDGTADEITFTYSLVDPWEDGLIRVRRVGISEPLRVIPVDPPNAPGGEATLDYDGTDADGVPLPSGNYTATLAVSRIVDGEPLFTPYPVAFEVDLDVMAPTGLAPSAPSVYPHPDGYRDTAALTWSDAEPYAQVDLQVRNAADATVRLMTDVASGVAWDGRDDAAGLVPAGLYSVRLRAYDDLGNRVWTAPLQIRVSHKVLVTRTQSVTVKPKATRVEGGDIGDCSRWRVPSLHGWPRSASHLSNVRCNGGTGDRSVVWTIHSTQLPAAVKYRRVQLSWFGGPTISKGCESVNVSCDVGVATLYEKDGSAVQWFATRDYLVTQYVAWAPAADVVRTGRRVKWAMSVSGGNRYDVKKFTLIYRADVLVDPA